MTNHAQPQGFLSIPASGKGPGVLVLHAWWGLNDTIKAFCSRLADEGFMVYAPDLYHGEVAETIQKAEVLGSALDDNYLQAKAEIVDAATYLLDQTQQPESGLAVIGFSLGVFYALDLAAGNPDLIRSVVLFYGTGGGDFSTSQAAFLGHFAELDPYEPRANVDHLEDDLKQAGRQVKFYHYPGTGHWFFEPDRADAYNPAAADLAWERTMVFLKEHYHL